jgi:hypothetical protein
MPALFGFSPVRDEAVNAKRFSGVQSLWIFGDEMIAAAHQVIHKESSSEVRIQHRDGRA